LWKVPWKDPISRLYIVLTCCDFGLKTAQWMGSVSFASAWKAQGTTGRMGLPTLKRSWHIFALKWMDLMPGPQAADELNVFA
jgi:hypothetical protein